MQGRKPEWIRQKNGPSGEGPICFGSLWGCCESAPYITFTRGGGGNMSPIHTRFILRCWKFGLSCLPVIENFQPIASLPVAPESPG